MSICLISNIFEEIWLYVKLTVLLTSLLGLTFSIMVSELWQNCHFSIHIRQQFNDFWLTATVSYASTYWTCRQLSRLQLLNFTIVWLDGLYEVVCRVVTLVTTEAISWGWITLAAIWAAVKSVSAASTVCIWAACVESRCTTASQCARTLTTIRAYIVIIWSILSNKWNLYATHGIFSTINLRLCFAIKYYQNLSICRFVLFGTLSATNTGGALRTAGHLVWAAHSLFEWTAAIRFIRQLAAREVIRAFRLVRTYVITSSDIQSHRTGITQT